jgi:hypothetical protein
MLPHSTVAYMAEQINRSRLDAVASRGWMAEQAAANRSHVTASPRRPRISGAPLGRLSALVDGTRRAPSAATTAVSPLQ